MITLIKFQTEFSFKTEKDHLVIGIFSDELHPIIGQIDRLLNKKLTLLLHDEFISTDLGAITPIYTLDQLNTKAIYLVGLGASQDFTLTKSKTIFAKIKKTLKQDAVLLLDTFEVAKHSISEVAHIAAESITLASYQVQTYKSNQSEASDSTISIHSKTHIDSDIRRGIIYAEATNEARQLVNEPGNKLTPTALAQSVLSFTKEYGLEARIVEKPEMQELGMGGLLGVNQGSTEEPKMIVAKYQGTPRFENITALVGKGLTFDTGGYCLKPRTGMLGMNSDMGGAASAFGAFMIAVRLKLPVNLLLVIPSTDNMVSADAIKPGDVVRMMSGKTVEVTNTDAEGRLILADGITFAKHLGASKIINLATLTGAICVALGDITGAFTNNQAFFDSFYTVSELMNEEIWPMPIRARHHEALRSSLVADLDNSPKNNPGAIAAATFLKEFAEDTPWIHLDIAGTAVTHSSSDLNPKGGTGVMVRTIAKYLELSSQQQQ